MALSLVTRAESDPVSLDEARAFLQIEVSDDDALIRSLVSAATEHVETYTHRKCLSQTWDLKLDGFPCDEIVLPFPPVSEVVSITYLDTAGDEQTWDADEYDVDLPAGPQALAARIHPVYGSVFPSTRHVMNAVTVRFTCGYEDADEVPAALKTGLLFLVRHWYTNREPVVIGAGLTALPIPQTVDALIWPYRAC